MARRFSFEFFAIVSLVDTALIAVLIRWFLVMSERPREAILGARPIGHEALRGLVLLPPVFLLVGGVVLGLRAVAPWMQTVEHSPLEAFMQTPLQAGIFGIVVVIAGGIREELQRAFILHRFDQRLGGIRLGLVLFSMAFGLMHYDQGADVAAAVWPGGPRLGAVLRAASLGGVGHGQSRCLQRRTGGSSGAREDTRRVALV